MKHARHVAVLQRRKNSAAAASPHPHRPGDAGRVAASGRAHRYALGLDLLLRQIERETGRSAEIIAAELSRRGIRKPRGGTVWTPPDVRKLMHRLRTGP